MGATSSAVDHSPLQGGQVDVLARLGWTLRTSRLLAPGVRLEDVARCAGVSTTQAHRAETGQLRSGRLVAAYEEILGLAPGFLQAAVDAAHRAVDPAARDRDPAPVLRTLTELSSLTERIADPSSELTGGEWFLWARSIRAVGGIGLPVHLARAMVARLCRELQLACGPCFTPRGAALTLIREGPYADVVLDVARELAVADGGPIYDIAAAVGHAWCPATTGWALSLVTSGDERLAVAGAYCLSRIVQLNPPAVVWPTLAGPLVAAFARAEEESPAWRWSSRLLLEAPAEVRRLREEVTPRQLAREPAPADWGRSRRNRWWTECERASAAVTDALGLAEQPMLSRFLFDLTLPVTEVPAMITGVLLAALPEIAEPTLTEVVALAERSGSEIVRGRATRRAVLLCGTRPHPHRQRWSESEHGEIRAVGLFASGVAGLPPTARQLDRALTSGGVEARYAVQALGLARDDRLAAVAADDSLPAPLPGIARWHRTAGPRITR